MESSNIIIEKNPVKIVKNESSVTFTFDIKKEIYDIEKYKQYKQYKQYKPEHKLCGKKFYNECRDTIAINSHTEHNLVHPNYENGLINTIFKAYSEHIPLKLRPDDIWLSILIAFGKYVKDHSEELRDHIVSHQGIKEVEVKYEYDPDNLEAHWFNMTNLIMDKMKENVKDGIVEWSTPNFTTTTDKDKFIANFSLMSGFRKFFSYGGSLCCGLSEVTLEGTSNDWKELIRKAEKLYEFNDKNLSDWADLLIPVLQEFVNVFDMKINEDFWQRVCTYKDRGSGGEKYFRGWFLVFCPFSNNGKYILNPIDKVNEDHVYGNVADDELGDAEVEVDVIFNNNGVKLTYTLFGGVMMTQYDKINNVLSPACDYLVIKSKFVTFDDMNEAYQKELKKHPWKCNKKFQEMGVYDIVIKFAHYVANESNLPNNMFISLGSYISNLYLNKKEIPVKQNILKECYSEFSLEYSDFIKPDMKDDMIKSFLESPIGSIELGQFLQ